MAEDSRALVGGGLALESSSAQVGSCSLNSDRCRKDMEKVARCWVGDGFALESSSAQVGAAAIPFLPLVWNWCGKSTLMLGGGRFGPGAFLCPGGCAAVSW